jgi:predicted metalloprotease
VDANDPGAVFTRKVLATTEDAWTAALPQMGKSYAAPTLVLFRGQVESACGLQEAAVGPFYCPGDRKAYLDLDFLDELQTKLGAQGDFAAAYVIAHEVGHHVQKLLGTSDRVSAEGKDKGPKGNAVRLELQADCYAGVWGAYAKKKGLLDVGDVEEALGAASAIGDDTLQRRAKGRVNPESFSHGSSEQRVRWFKRGMENGDPRSCDTFAASAL